MNNQQTPEINSTPESSVESDYLDCQIKLGLSSSCDADIAALLIDKSVLELDESGKIVGGLEDQISTLRELKPYLFKTKLTSPTPPDSLNTAETYDPFLSGFNA